MGRDVRAHPTLSIRDVARFHSGYQKLSTGCWEWQRYRLKTGLPYGQYQVHRTSWSAHRISYLIHYGWFDPALFVRHKVCDNPPCVNPLHLELGTHQDNMDDCVESGRRPYGTNHHKAKLSSLDVLAIRALSKSGVPYREIAARFELHFSSVGYIVRRKTWSFLDDNGIDTRTGKCVV